VLNHASNVLKNFFLVMCKKPINVIIHAMSWNMLAMCWLMLTPR